MLGDGYIAQHVRQAYREYTEQTSYKVYMSSVGKIIAEALTGREIERSWKDILDELDGSVTPEQTETEQEIKSRILAKLNGKEG